MSPALPGMPEMPEPAVNIAPGDWSVIAQCRYFTADQLRAYGESCFAAGRAEASKDAERLDWLEQRIDAEGEIHLHDGAHPRGIGLGLFKHRDNARSLRNAIDTAMAPPAATPTKEQP